MQGVGRKQLEHRSLILVIRPSEKRSVRQMNIGL